MLQLLEPRALGTEVSNSVVFYHAPEIPFITEGITLVSYLCRVN
jgi:hypothetical protein